MKTKKIINLDESDRSACAFGSIIFPLFTYFSLPGVIQEIGAFPNHNYTLQGAITSIFVINGVFCIYYFLFYPTKSYILTPDKIWATGGRGKILNEIYVSEIVQTGIVGEKLMVAGEQSEYFDMPRYIYLSKRVLTEDERKDILRAASDGSVLLFRYSDKLKYALNEICGIYVG